MALKVVWNSPLPLTITKLTLQRIRNDQFGTVYAVTMKWFMEEFEVIQGEVA
jgi:hypothetical protein